MPRRKAHASSSTSYTQRRVDTREPFPRFLIVCEGEKTEPHYFKSFRVSSVVVEIAGIGLNTLKLVQKAIQLKGRDDYDQVWCVFDRDVFPAQDFNDAITLAAQEGIRTAYSNEAFELWYMLHFDYLNTAISRVDYITKLEQRIGRKYAKNSREMYALLESLQATAISNARNLMTANGHPSSSPASDNPSTTVHLLVEELRKYIR